MKFALTHDEYIKYQTERVLAVITAATCKKGFITAEEAKKIFNISTPDLLEIRDLLIAQGKIEQIP